MTSVCERRDHYRMGWLRNCAAICLVRCGSSCRQGEAGISSKPVLPSIAGGFGWLLTGAKGTASGGLLCTLSVFFLKAGASVFGSGLAIVPFLYGGVVSQFHCSLNSSFLTPLRWQ